MKESTAQELQASLLALRPILLTKDGRSFLGFFDEFMEQREFGLALHAICDFILDPSSPGVDNSVLDLIQKLHVAMEIKDDCVEELRTLKLA